LDAGAVAERLRTIASAGELAELRSPNFSGCRQNVQEVYEVNHYAPAWVRDGHVPLPAQRERKRALGQLPH
jgi:hypothetical protein